MIHHSNFIRAELAARGVKLHDVTSCQLQLLAEAYAQAHRNELIRPACNMVRTGAELQQLAEKEARRRAKANPKPKDVTPIRQLITYSKG